MRQKALAQNNKPERNRLKRLFNAKARAEKEEYYNSIATEAEAAAVRNDLRTTYRIIRRLCRSDHPSRSVSTQRHILDYCA